MSPLLRDMTLADVDSVLRIEQDVHAHPWTRGNFSDALASGYVCKVYENDGAMLGYAVLMPGVGEVELLDISIAAAHQRKGLGRSLLDATMRIARDLKARRMLLEVRASNAAALGLYSEAGFSRINLRRGYYQSAYGREDAIVMERIL
ncbi:MAG: ribosomal protein S18-alanine N-acetyltransferase [Nitrosomonadales bacterium]|nr:ribosomal protein S18-alanine N-acetyltransferase [Nitrosomonadales bacterium]